MNSIKKIIYNCSQATFLIEKKQIGKLTFTERFELTIHLAGCSVCRLFQKQSMIINRLLHRITQDSPETKMLEKDFKEMMQRRIEERLNQ